MKSLAILFTGVLFVLLAACTVTGEVEPVSSDMLEAATVVARPSATPSSLQKTRTPPPIATMTPTWTSTATHAVTHTPTVDPTVLTTTPWPPDPIPSPTPVPPFPGMVYTTDEGLWRVNANWQPELLFDRSGVLEPNGRRVLYEQDGDVWLADLDMGTRQNLTNTPNNVECCPQWWPGLPSLLLYSEFDQFTNSYRPISFNLASQETKSFVEQEAIINGHAPVPSREVIALASQNSLSFSDLQGSDEQFETLYTNLPAGSQIQNIYLPVWSRDGDKLAVLVEGQFPGESSGTILLLIGFDWQTIAPFYLENVGAADTFSVSQISPTGEWIVLQKTNVESQSNEINMIRVDGWPGNFTIDHAKNPVWSPDGRYLLYQTDEGSFLTTPPEFTTKINLYLPSDARVLDWQELP